jgi:hypothetical protein
MTAAVGKELGDGFDQRQRRANGISASVSCASG